MPPIRTLDGANPVPVCVTAQRLMSFVRARNPRLTSRFDGIASVYQAQGDALGVRWDYAFFHMLVQTNNLSFEDGNGADRSVRPEQNNFAGLGAVGPSDSGEAFPDIATGVQAHLEHILIYSGQAIDIPVAERTEKVQAWGVLDGWLQSIDGPVTYRDLALRWFPFAPTYADKLATVGATFYAQHCPGVAAVPVAFRNRSVGRIAETEVAAEISTGWYQTDARSRARPREGVGASGRGPARNAPVPQAARSAGPAITPPVPQLVVPGRGVQIASLGGGSGSSSERQARSPSQSLTEAPRAPAAEPRPTQSPPAAEKRSKQRAARPARKPRAKPKPKARIEPRLSPDDAVKALVGGRLVHLKTDMGATIPVKFNKSGFMSGQAGGLAFFLGAARDTGRWWVERAKLCKRWKIWLSGRTMCLKLRKRGRLVHWRADDGRSGTARIVR